MKAVCWHGSNDVRVDQVPDPKILNPRDAIIKITSTAICGSDLHLYDGYIPTMKSGDILGHEFMGEVVELGPEVNNLKKGDRVVVPFTISCGNCFFCNRDLWSLCDNSNPNQWIAEKFYGHSPSGLFGYSHMFGGYAGGQAEYARVPFADVGPMKIPDGLTLRSGQTHVHKYLHPLLERIQKGEIDPSFVITHKMALEDAPKGYKIFRDKQENCIKVVLKP